MQPTGVFFFAPFSKIQRLAEANGKKDGRQLTLPTSLQQLMQLISSAPYAVPGIIWTRWKSLARMTMLHPEAYA